MRRSVVRSFGSALFAGALALAATGAAIAEDAELEQVASEGSQIIPAGLVDMKPGTKNLNTVPEDGLGPQNVLGPNNGLVRKLMAARPNEDLIICVAGCFSDRDRVVYAQPIEKPAAKRTADANATGQ